MLEFGEEYLGKVSGQNAYKRMTSMGDVIEVGGVTLVYKRGDSTRACIYRLRKAVAKYGL